MSQYFAPLRGLRFYFFDFICDSKSDEIVARTYSSTCFLEGPIYIANYASIVDFSARYPLVCQVLRPGNLVKKISNLAKKITGSGKCPSLTGNKLQGLQTETCYHRFLGRSDRLRDTGSRVTYHRVLTSALDFPGLTLCHQRPPNTTSGFLAVLPLPGFGPHVLIRHSRSLRCLGETFPFKSILTRGGLE